MSASNEHYWPNFIRKHLVSFIHSLEKSEKKANADLLLNDIDYLAELTPRQAYGHLKSYLNDSAVKRISERYRADKYRRKNNKKTLQINELTHNQIMDMKELMEVDTVDETLYVLLSRKYSQEADEVRREFGERVYPGEYYPISRLAERLSKKDRLRLGRAIQEAFQQGWKSAKQHRGRQHDADKAASIRYLEEEKLSIE